MGDTFLLRMRRFAYLHTPGTFTDANHKSVAVTLLCCTVTWLGNPFQFIHFLGGFCCLCSNKIFTMSSCRLRVSLCCDYLGEHFFSGDDHCRSWLASPLSLLVTNRCELHPRG